MQANKYIVFLVAALPLFTGCKKWLDVKPKTQVDAELLYQRESGFKDVLTGAYVNMASAEMYGREMTFGFVDAVGNVYPNTGSFYGNARNNDYANTILEPVITAMWTKSYNTIANINNLIIHLDGADKNLFQTDNYNVIRGEALGLRAFLHLDMLRLFAPSYKSKPAAPAIPYVTTYSFNITPVTTVTAVLDSVLSDLKAAATFLQQSDPIKTGRAITSSIDDGYLLNRNYHMNYYAVKAVMARAYLYKGDLANAALCADEIIASQKFPWTRLDQIAVLDDTKRDRSFTPEQVLVLDVPHLSDYIKDRLQEAPGGYSTNLALYYLTKDINSLYSFANDWRKLYFWSPERSSTYPDRYSTKLRQPEGIPANLAQRVALVRLPELFLISAEAAFDTDPEKARKRINELRLHRGFEVEIPAGTPATALRNELLLEYRREFVGEGLLFYYYKRLDADKMEWGPAVFNKEKYVVPIPVVETEFR